MMEISWITLSCYFMWIHLAVVARDLSDEDSHEDSDEHHEHGGGNPPVLTFAIAAGAISGVILVGALCALCCWFMVKNQRSRRNTRTMSSYGTERPSAPPHVNETESTFSQQPQLAGTNMVILRDHYEDGGSFRIEDGRRESPPPAYESLFSDGNNQVDVGSPAKLESIKN